MTSVIHMGLSDIGGLCPSFFLHLFVGENYEQPVDGNRYLMYRIVRRTHIEVEVSE